MWKWIVAGVAGLVVAVAGVGFYLSDKIYIRWPHAVVTAADFSRKYSPEQLKTDFAYLTRMAEHIHPDIAGVTDESYPALKAKARTALNQPMTRAEFFRVLAPFAGRAYHDGHTEIASLSEEWEAYKAAGGRAPPFFIRFDGNRILIARALGVLPAEGAELVSLNGVSAHALQDWLINTESAETREAQKAFAGRHFAMRMWEYGLRPPFAIRTRLNGKESVVTSRGMPIAQWERASRFEWELSSWPSATPDQFTECRGDPPPSFFANEYRFPPDKGVGVSRFQKNNCQDVGEVTRSRSRYRR
jgi:hypothetical protein